MHILDVSIPINHRIYNGTYLESGVVRLSQGKLVLKRWYIDPPPSPRFPIHAVRRPTQPNEAVQKMSVPTRGSFWPSQQEGHHDLFFSFAQTSAQRVCNVTMSTTWNEYWHCQTNVLTIATSKRVPGKTDPSAQRRIRTVVMTWTWPAPVIFSQCNVTRQIVGNQLDSFMTQYFDCLDLYISDLMLFKRARKIGK